ncbi:MAG: GAF domain-containing sensor histidine kinase [Haloferacaceae archaeon]
MTASSHVFLVTDGEPPDGVLEALASEWAVSVRRPGDVETSGADCLVCCDPFGRAWAAQSAPSVPCVTCGDAPTTRGASAAGRTDGSGSPGAAAVTDEGGSDCHPDAVVASVRRALAAADRDAAKRDRRVTQLHEGVSGFAALREPEAVFERTVEIAEDVLAFDRCVAMRHHDGVLVPVAHSGDTEVGDARPMSVDVGVGGWCFRKGEPRLVDRVDQDPIARPSKSGFASGISVPIGEHGVFQAVSTEPDAFDEWDLNLAELLAAHAGETLSRIETTAELRDERDRLRSLFENVPDPAIAFEFVDGDPVFRRVNAAFEDVFGYGSETVVGESVDEYVLPDEEGERRRGERFNRRLREGENVSAEVVRRTRDGRRHFILQVIPLELDSHNLSGFAIYTDITEQQEREQKLKRQNERLDEFASIISHDLRNPLSVAMGFLELARKTGDPEHFDRVDRALDDMQEFLDDLLRLAREGRLVGELVETTLERVSREAWERVAAEDAILSFEGNCSLSVDESRTVELFENLFVNALEHAGPGVTVRVGALPCDSDDPPGFYVADDGPGIPAGERERVFDSGYTTDEAGTGLGLAIVDRIAEAHGWDVEVTQSDAGGARFEFYFGE